MKTSRFIILLLLLLLLLPTPSLFSAQISAQESDAITLSADQGEVDYNKKISRYTGNVVLTQGKMSVRGETLLLYFNDQNQLVRMTINGERAFFEHRSEDEKETLQARALQISYQLQPSPLLELTDEAELWQGQSRFNGEKIEYDFQTDIVRATGGDGEKGRVNVTIFPYPPKENE